MNQPSWPYKSLTSSLKALFASDIHLGHNKTITSHIITSMNITFCNEAMFEEIDLLVLGGDIFHSDLLLRQMEVDQIRTWMEDVIRKAAKHNVVVRVLEGTPSHDWGQSKMFTEINNYLGNICDLRHVCDVEIEYHERLKLSILYVPDEYRETCKETQGIVEQVMVDGGYEQIDVLAMHGYLGYQAMGEQYQPDVHDTTFYMNICRHVISIGHVHRFSRYKKAFAQGSVERLAHGEEEPKGVVLADLDMANPKKDKIKFIENINSKRYDTVDISNDEDTFAHAKILQKANELPLGSYIRILSTRDCSILQNVAEYRRLFPNLNWSSKRETSKEEKEVQIKYESTSRAMPVSITPNNIGDLVGARMQHLPPATQEAINTLLEKVKHV